VAQLLTALESQHPIIAFVRTAFLDHWEQDVAHTVVIVGAQIDEHFWLHDPAQPKGPVSVSWDGLLAAWAEFGYRGAMFMRGTS